MTGNHASANARPLVLIGAGGHARVLLGLIRALGSRLEGVCDPELVSRGTAEWSGERVLGDDTVLATLGPVAVVNGIGFVPGSTLRRKIQDMIDAQGHAQPVLCHPAAFVDPSACLGPGVQVMAGTVIQPRPGLKPASWSIPEPRSTIIVSLAQERILPLEPLFVVAYR